MARFVALAVETVNRGGRGDSGRARARRCVGEGEGGGVALTLVVPAAVKAEPEGQAIPLNIVFEDPHLIVIDKQAGLVVHPAAGNRDGTLVNALIAHCGDSLRGIGGELRPGIVHRIDKDTTGLMVAAKTEKAHTSLGKQFAAHAIERVYKALVWGVPRERAGHDRRRARAVAFEPAEDGGAARRRESGADALQGDRDVRFDGGARGVPAGDGAHASGARSHGAYRASADRRSGLRAAAFRAGVELKLKRQALHAAVLGLSASGDAQNRAFRECVAGRFHRNLSCVQRVSRAGAGVLKWPGSIHTYCRSCPGCWRAVDGDRFRGASHGAGP